jgi:Ca2+-binding RTX toxin-like protein
LDGLLGEDGDDSINGQGGADTVAGGNGNDSIADDPSEIDETFELIFDWIDQT